MRSARDAIEARGDKRKLLEAQDVRIAQEMLRFNSEVTAGCAKVVIYFAGGGEVEASVAGSFEASQRASTASL